MVRAAKILGSQRVVLQTRWPRPVRPSEWPQFPVWTSPKAICSDSLVSRIHCISCCDMWPLTRKPGPFPFQIENRHFWYFIRVIAHCPSRVSLMRKIRKKKMVNRRILLPQLLLRVKHKARSLMKCFLSEFRRDFNLGSVACPSPSFPDFLC